MYPEEIVIPMKEQLTFNGFEDLTTAEKVDEAMKKEGTTLVMVNSVCGCAAGAARPGVLLSLTGEKAPKNLTTVFAGFDLDAVKRVREYLMPFPPSSPAVALFKDGELVHMLERHHIEGHSAQAIAENLKQAYAEFV
ncbi:BrxA/BrxB family bacilliredoxin [Moheibacter lacus]|uniref:BrxA/BrxB family bacilliredoxin n=1 Tax=Moheibacter lacus TaxID=2745851 RepID=A0A838ZNX7_9FLAO|nr:BrxA/BrxB family bacilliredoxin [Moheibacter lacus]MBA5629007.1 BrxA/BrxB family bacilliredoxin [Moheibacter lacus]